MRDFLRYFFNNARKSRAFVLSHYPDARVDAGVYSRIVAPSYRFTKSVIGGPSHSDNAAWIDARKNLQCQLALENEKENRNQDVDINKRKNSAVFVDAKEKIELF